MVSLKEKGVYWQAFKRARGLCKAGALVWMKNNLAVTHFRNGDPIPIAQDVDYDIDVPSRYYPDGYHIKENSRTGSNKRINIIKGAIKIMLTVIYEIPKSVKDMFEQGETSYRIVDYTIQEMDNNQSMQFFLDCIGATDDNIDIDDGTQVIVKHPDFEHKLVIDSGGLGDFYSHGYDVTVLPLNIFDTTKLEEIIEELENTADYWKDLPTPFTQGRMFQASRTLEQLKSYIAAHIAAQKSAPLKDLDKDFAEALNALSTDRADNKPTKKRF